MSEISSNKNQAAPGDNWVSGSAYEAYVGRWSRLVAAEFVGWLARPPGQCWLDTGCGTGRLTGTILNQAEPSAICGLDASPGFIRLARRQMPDKRASLVVGDAQRLPFRPECFDTVVSGLVLNFLPDQAGALREMRRVTRPGGLIAAYIWDYAGRMQLMRFFWDAAAALDPQAAALDEGIRFGLSRPEPLLELFKAAGLAGVEVRAIDVPTVFRDFNDYWEPFLGGQGPAPSYVATLEQAQKERLCERLRQALPLESDGSIHLIARAWAVRGQQPV